jgi:hypothetical protein
MPYRMLIYWNDHGFRPLLAKKFMKSHLNIKKLGMVVHTCHPSSGRKLQIGRLQSKPPGQNSETLSPK